LRNYDKDTTMSAVLNDHHVRRIVHCVAPLQRNPWQGWSEGANVTRHYEHRDYLRGEGVVSVNDIVFEVVEFDKRVHRIEKIQGATKRQEFLIADEQGLTKAKRAAVGIDAALMIDGTMVMSVLRKIKEADTEYERFINKDVHQWSLAAFPSILLRYESDELQWHIQSLNRRRQVGEHSLNCVKLAIQKQISLNEIHNTTRYLSAKVPGHLVEEQQHYYRKDPDTAQLGLLWSSRELTAGFRGHL